MTDRRPCEWIVTHLEDIPVRCGDDHFVTVGTTSVCVDHFQFFLLHRDEVTVL